MAKVVWREKALLLLEALLAHRGKMYRGATIMKNFKLIHYFDVESDTVYIDYIWDMRMNPVKLKRMKFDI